jgi:hypothetical protein
MASPEPFKDKDEVVAAVLEYYRAHTSELSGPTAACQVLGPVLMRRMPAALRNELALIGVAHLTQRHATAGTSPDKGWDPTVSTLQVRRVTTDASDDPGETMDISVTRIAYTGPTEIYPTILMNTVYSTETGAKPLILFTLQDFRFVNEHLETQQMGLARRQAALRYGARLLRQHGAEVVAELPSEVLALFETRWKQALAPLVKKKGRDAA